MNAFTSIWLAVAALLFAGLYALKSLRTHRLARIKDMHWRGLLVIALIAGALVAFLYTALTPRQVALPEGLADRPAITPVPSGRTE